MDFLLEGERLDDLQIKGYQIIQNPSKFCFGMDAVLLSSFAKARRKDRVMDFCTGTGIVPILMAAKTPCNCFTAVEIQKESADMARRSVLLNHLEERIQVYEADIKEAASLFGRASFDVVTVNPPYMNENHGLTNPDLPKAIARHELLCTLENVVEQAGMVLKEGGNFYMVHRPHRLVEIMNVCSAHRLEIKRMQLIHPYLDRKPNMVLLEAKKGGNSYLRIEKPLVIYEKDGRYTQELLRCYGMGNA